MPITDALRSWSTVFAAICLQATPYVVLGTVLAGLVPHVSSRLIGGRLARHPMLAVPALGLAGAALPGCECGSVPAAAALLQRGVAAGPTVSFMTAAPAVNPVVLVATAAAFPGEPAVVAARFVAGLATALLLGALAAGGALGSPRAGAHEHRHGGPAQALPADLLRSLGLVTIGAAAAATAAVAIPPAVIQRLARPAPLGVLTLAALATVLCVCSQADAFVARSFAGFSRTAQLAFMVAGSVSDLKIVALQAGEFGPRFGLRCAAAGSLVSIGAACAAAAILL